MKKIKTNFPNQTDTRQNQKPEGHKDNKPTGFHVCGLSILPGKENNFPVTIYSSTIDICYLVFN